MTANPIELVGGLATTGNVTKADLIAWAKARVPQVLADATEIRNTVLAGQLMVLVKSTGATYTQDVADTTSGDDGLNCIVSSDGKRFKSTLGLPRDKLTTARTYFVSLTGSDTNSGLTGAPWRTLQHAVDFVSQNIDLAGQDLFVQAGDGLYPENLVLPGVVGLGRQAQGSAIILGNASNHSAVIIQPASGGAVLGVDTLSGWTLKNMALNCTAAITVHADYNSSIYLDGVVLGGTPNIQVQATFAGSFVEFINNPYVVSGTFLSHASAVNGGQVVWQGGAICSFSGTVSVGAGFLQISGGGTMSPGAAFNGLTATGAGTTFTIDYGGSLRTSNDLDPNAVLPAGLLPGTVNIWPVQAGVSFNNAVSAVKANLQVSGRALHGDSNYTIIASDAPFLQTSAALSAPRTWTLPLSNSLPTGSLLTISDAGGISGANTLTVQRQGSDLFSGVGVASNAIAITAAFGSITVRNDGAAGWYLVGKT